MTAEPVEARISAYLDDELSPDERAQVETLLAENAAARQLHDELRALRTSMKSLERHKLDDRFTAEVMRRARQAAAEAQEKSQPKVSLAPPTSELSWWRRGSGMRRWVWPAAAVAAALAVLLYDSTQRTGERQVAQMPDEQTEDLSLSQPNRPESGRGEPAANGVAPTNNDLRWSAPPGQADGAAGAAPLALEKRENYSLRAQPSVRAPLAPPPAEESMPATTPAPAAAPDAAPSDSAPMVRSLAKARAIVPPQVEFEVPAEYLRDKRFEALLTEQKVPWKNVALAAAKDELAEDRSARYAADKHQTVNYQITVTREQLAALLAGLPQKTERGRASELFDAYYYAEPESLRMSGNRGAATAVDEKSSGTVKVDKKVNKALPLQVESKVKESDASGLAAQPRAIVIRLRAPGSVQPAAPAGAPPK